MSLNRINKASKKRSLEIFMYLIQKLLFFTLFVIETTSKAIKVITLM